jgi:hypothetical protein
MSHYLLFQPADLNRPCALFCTHLNVLENTTKPLAKVGVLICLQSLVIMRNLNRGVLNPLTVITPPQATRRANTHYTHTFSFTMLDTSTPPLSPNEVNPEEPAQGITHARQGRQPQPPQTLSSQLIIAEVPVRSSLNGKRVMAQVPLAWPSLVSVSDDCFALVPLSLALLSAPPRCQSQHNTFFAYSAAPFSHL